MPSAESASRGRAHRSSRRRGSRTTPDVPRRCGSRDVVTGSPGQRHHRVPARNQPPWVGQGILARLGLLDTGQDHLAGDDHRGTCPVPDSCRSVIGPGKRLATAAESTGIRAGCPTPFLDRAEHVVSVDHYPDRVVQRPAGPRQAVPVGRLDRLAARSPIHSDSPCPGTAPQRDHRRHLAPAA